MPERYTCNFEITNDPIPKFTGIETIQCPGCGCSIIVNNTFTDYSVLYEKTLKASEEMHKGFNKMINGLCEEVPDLKIFLYEQRKVLQEKLNELRDNFK